MNNFSSKSTRPTDMLLLLKDTLSIEDDKLFKACRSVCLSVHQNHMKRGPPNQSVKFQHFNTIFSLTIEGISRLYCIYAPDHN